MLLSPFAETVTRTSAAQADIRNEFVAAISHAVFIPHASPGGKAEATARNVLERGQPLFTIDAEHDSQLVTQGAQPYNLARVINAIAL